MSGYIEKLRWRIFQSQLERLERLIERHKEKQFYGEEEKKWRDRDLGDYHLTPNNK